MSDLTPDTNTIDAASYESGKSDAVAQAAKIVRSTEGKDLFLGDIADLILADADARAEQIVAQGSAYTAGYAYGVQESFETIEYAPATATLDQMVEAVERGDWTTWDFEAEERAQLDSLGL